MNNIVFHWENRVSWNDVFTRLMRLKLHVLSKHTAPRILSHLLIPEILSKAVTVAVIGFQANNDHLTYYRTTDQTHQTNGWFNYPFHDEHGKQQGQIIRVYLYDPKNDYPTRNRHPAMKKCDFENKFSDFFQSAIAFFAYFFGMCPAAATICSLQKDEMLTLSQPEIIYDRLSKKQWH